MKFEPDYSECMENIAPGAYIVELAGFENRVGFDSKKPYISWQLKIVGGEFEGRNVSYNTPLSGQGAVLLKDFLKTIDPFYDGLCFDADDYFGVQMEIKLQEKIRADKTVAKYPHVTIVRSINKERKI